MSDKPLQMEEASKLRKPVRRGLGWLAALCLCGLFLAGCLVAAQVSQSAPVTEKKTESASYSFEQMIPEGMGKPVSVTIARADDTFTLVAEDGAYHLENDTEALDANAAGEILACGESILARRRLEGAPEDYGINDQSTRVCFRYENGSEFTLRLGEAVPTGEGWYAAVNDDPTVYIVNNALAKTLSVDKLRLYAMPDLSDAFTAQTLLKVTIEQPGKDTIALARVTEANHFNTKVELTEPIHYPANSERAAEIYLDMEKLQPAALADANGADEDWGLAQPVAVLTLEDQTTTRLTIGLTSDGYAMRINDDRAVYTLAADAMDFLGSLTVPWLAEQLPGLVMLSQVSAMDVTAGEKTLHVDVDQPNGKYQINGKNIAEDTFLPVYQQTIGLLIERYVSAPEQTGDPRLQIEYTFTDGTQWTLTLAEYDEQFDLIIREECACFLISRSKTDALIESLFHLQEE